MNEERESESTATIVVAIIVNLLITAFKSAAAIFTGSSAMLSEAIHSGVDTLNEALLYVGVSRSKRPPDAANPLGHGQELYFWTLIVAVVIFGAGGSVSIVEGLERLAHPQPLANVVWSYAVLGAALVLESVSWTVAYRALRKRAGTASTWRIIRESKDPTVFTVLLEDTAALTGLGLALAGTLAQQLGVAAADGLASVGIGLVLCGVAFIVIRESRGLISGESASPLVVNGVRAILGREPAVERVESIVTHFGPDRVLLVLTLVLVPLSTAELTETLARLRKTIEAEFPAITNISLSLASFAVPILK